MYYCLRQGIHLPVTVIDVKDLPAVRQEALLDVLSERDRSVTIDGDVFRLRLSYEKDHHRHKTHALTVIIVDLTRYIALDYGNRQSNTIYIPR